jgi:hypothetical protein
MKVWREDGVPGTFGFSSANHDLKIKQPLSQYFASRMLNLEWLQPGDGQHRLYGVTGDVTSTIEAGPTTRFLLPPASITILRGRVAMPK